MFNFIYFFLNFVSRKDVFCYLLLYIIIILIIGTVDQAYIGLYKAQEKYFSSIYFLFWYIPLPGGFTILFFLFTGLLVKIFNDGFILRRVGTFIVHFGILILLVGCFISMLFGNKGIMIINEDEDKNYIISNNIIELIVTNVHNKKQVKFDENVLFDNNILKFVSFPFNINLHIFCKNCCFVDKVLPLSKNSTNVTARFIELYSTSLFKTKYDDRAGVSLIIDNDFNKVYNIYENFLPQYFLFDNVIYKFELRKKYEYLPFTLHLNKFEKESYPNTNIFKKYKSILSIKDDGLEWNEYIEMNKPLRYKGYVFYQSSFMENNGKIATVLLVSKNFGSIFPYISGVIISIGLLLHLFQSVTRLLRR